MNKTYILLALVFSMAAHTGQQFSADSGLPALDREWHGRDYLSVYTALDQGDLALPVLADQSGERFFERLVDPQNFALNRNRDLPLDQRMLDFQQIQQGFNSILRIYAFKANDGEELSTEIATMMAFSLQISALGVDLVNELMPTIPNDERYEARMQGLQTMYDGLTTSFVGAEVSLSETGFYSKGDLSIILQGMAKSLPKLIQGFSSDYKQELKGKLRAHQQNFTGTDLELLRNMIQQL